MPRVYLSPSRLRRQPPPRGGLTARHRRADGTSRTPPPTKTTRRPLRGAAPACQRTPAFATVSGEIFTFWIGAQNLAGNCCDFDGGICGRGTDCHGAARLAMTARRRRADGTSGTPSHTRKMTTLSGGHFLRFCAPVSEPARPRWGCWRPETHRCRCAWWWRRPC